MEVARYGIYSVVKELAPYATTGTPIWIYQITRDDGTTHGGYNMSYMACEHAEQMDRQHRKIVDREMDKVLAGK